MYFWCLNDFLKYVSHKKNQIDIFKSVLYVKIIK